MITNYLGDWLKLNLPFDWRLLPTDAALVGGAVRDAIISRQRDSLDLDFVVESKAVELAKKIANQYHAGFVVLDPQRQIARVVFKQTTVDFAQQEGASLTTDLGRRDFTINAIAYQPSSNSLIDPLGGYQDLQQRSIRMISAANLRDDPLRLLRAYRQAAQLDFEIESATMGQIRELAPLLSTVAAERVRTELQYLFEADRGCRWLAVAIADGVLSHWLKHTDQTKIKQLQKIDATAANLIEKWPQLKQWDDNWIIRAKLATLTATEPKQAQLELENLKYPRSEIRAVTKIVELLPKLQQLPWSLREQYFFFQAAQEVFPSLALVGLSGGITIRAIAPLLERYTNPDDPVVYPQPLITGNEIMQQLNLSPSPLIGELLTEVQVAQIQGKVKDSHQAIQFVARLLE